ncbi:hypothetical protein, conserved [Eimeria acervulina]|uniref:Uncharacterized protein n=1 Tax=Eimeria acervulina TaxID=5801 RepID=U6GRJ2_EIMAC|nr:hypothetical protein, conserved [Eimeria acervulina]CDI82871.1 hypothetical protein, conserved [Eimeria acervulina]
MVLSVLATLITEHIMKVQSSEYRARSLKVLLDKAQKLRRAAGVATKLCLSALSDGHTIDVFWDEWEVHRMGAITDSAFARDFRILLPPPTSQTASQTGKHIRKLSLINVWVGGMQATRYCVQDDKRLLLVTPSSISPGVGDIRYHLCEGNLTVSQASQPDSSSSQRRFSHGASGALGDPPALR